MSRFFVSVASQLPNGSQGPGFNLQVDATSYEGALEAAKPLVRQALKDSGLQQIDVPAEQPAAADKQVA